MAMKLQSYLLTIFLTFTSLIIFGQEDNTWISFWNKDSSLIGFKDKNNVVKIEPQFSSAAHKFDKIMIVSNGNDSNFETYYIIKSGRIFGKDSLYMFDNGNDCESEGFIRFRENKTHLIGMYNANGDVKIPAEYNYLTKLKNGMMVAHKGGKWDESKRSEIREFPWVGGTDYLIDSNNKILIKDFVFNQSINFFSLQISKQLNKEAIRKNFKAVDGNYYSFINSDKEFKFWLKDLLNKGFTKSDLVNISNKKITFWKEPDGWISEEKNNVLDKNFELIKTKLLQLNLKNCDYNIFDESLNPYIYDYESEEYGAYFNNCGQSKDWIYPVKQVVISYHKNKDLIQDYFEFLRTDEGYKLLSVTIRSDQLKF